MFLQVESEQLAIQPEILFHVGSLSITNAMLMGVLVTLILFATTFWITKSISLKPTKKQTILEMVIELFLGFLEQLTGSKKLAAALLPLIGSLFLFLGISNIIGLIPGLTATTYNGVPIFRTPTNDFNMTFSIATAMIILTQYASIKRFGLFGHLAKYFKFGHVVRSFKKGLGEGFISIIDFLIGLLDIISELAKVISLSLRLFGNMYAGEVLAAVLMGVFAILVPAPWTAMNLLVGLLQAMVFGSLTAAYYTLAVTEEEQEQSQQ